MKNYFYVDSSNNRVGPVSEEKLSELKTQGIIDARTYVWTEGMASWKPLSEVLPQVCVANMPPPFAAPPASAPVPPPSASNGAAQGWNVINAFTSNIKRYSYFKGRSCRSEFWYFILAQVVLSLLIGVCLEESAADTFDNVATVALMLPNMAICFRRLQDVGINGVAAAVLSFIFDLCYIVYTPANGFSEEAQVGVGFVLLIFYIILGCIPSKNANNPYGETPLSPL